MVVFFLFAAISGMLLAGNLDDAAKTLGQRVLARLASDETPNVTWREAAPPELKATLATALRRRVRNQKSVEILVSLSENFRGPVLIAEIVREGGNVVEMVNVSGDQTASRFALKLTLLWEQEAPILDVALFDERMFVLDGKGLTAYQRLDNQWRGAGTDEIVFNPVRDLRGHIETAKNTITVYVPGKMCVKALDAPAGLVCEDGGILTAGRNTLSEEGWPAHYAHAEMGGEHLLSEMDGRIHIYDAAHQALASFDGWGSDFAATTPCAGRIIVASEASGDAVSLYGLSNHRPVRLNEPVTLTGLVTALWPQDSGVVAIAKNSKTGRYEAYGVAVDCRN